MCARIRVPDSITNKTAKKSISSARVHVLACAGGGDIVGSGGCPAGLRAPFPYSKTPSKTPNPPKLHSSKLSCHPTRLGARKARAVFNRAARSPPGRFGCTDWLGARCCCIYRSYVPDGDRELQCSQHQRKSSGIAIRYSRQMSVDDDHEISEAMKAHG